MSDWEARMGERARTRRLAQEAEQESEEQVDWVKAKRDAMSNPAVVEAIEEYAQEKHPWPEGFACACIGSLINVPGAPCRCEMLIMAENLREARARGEEPDWLKLGWSDRD